MFALFCFDIWYLVTWPIFYIIKQLKKRYRYCTSAPPALKMSGNCWSVNIVTFTKNSRLGGISLLTFDMMEPTQIRIQSRPHKSTYQPFASREKHFWTTSLNKSKLQTENKNTNNCKRSRQNYRVLVILRSSGSILALLTSILPPLYPADSTNSCDGSTFTAPPKRSNFRANLRTVRLTGGSEW